MRKASAFLGRAALAAGVALAGSLPAAAADLAAAGIDSTARTLPSPTGQLDLRQAAIALRAQWLARGHTVQQLATTAAPTITGGSVAASTITIGNAGEFPTMSLSYSTDTPGLAYVSAQFASPSGKTVYGGGYSTYYYTQSGTLNFAITTPLSLYSQPGAWTLISATIVDNAGNRTTYNARQLKGLFNGLSFTVVNNGPVATAPPKIIAGDLLNSTVSLSTPLPLLEATITAKDKNGPGIYQAFVIIAPPGGGYSYYSLLPNTRPIKAGKIKANNVFGAGSPTGTWNIVGYGVCDYASNCSGSTRDADVIALLGTDTFTVTP